MELRIRLRRGFDSCDESLAIRYDGNRRHQLFPGPVSHSDLNWRSVVDDRIGERICATNRLNRNVTTSCSEHARFDRPLKIRAYSVKKYWMEIKREVGSRNREVFRKL
ncbi:Hypothetical protein NTJ_01335 [Nesidiocoris tenuis]|uniref:Uncharacterized protein n=1 Tax=Nesidiocoris tenuis TaxID=355587 RepID=A0ABN7ABN1_9HEMI|nr:Hypothetical protein NTJ_01335 [Nesidiocoris tenuis]